MKNLLNVIILTLALNFLALAGGVGWLWQTGKLDRKSATAIKEIIFPPVDPAATPTGGAATQPAASDPTTRPSSRLEALLARHAGVTTAAQQVDLVQQNVDAQVGQLDQRERQLEDLQRLITAAQTKLQNDRKVLETDRQQLTDEQQQNAKLAEDKGFQDSLTLYGSMPSKQVKGIFMTMNDATVRQYLQAMQPRNAAKIIKEFKSPEELDRVRRVLDKMRQGDATADPATQPTAQTPKDGKLP